MLRDRIPCVVAENDDIPTVICAPVYSEALGLTTEVVLGLNDGLPKTLVGRLRHPLGNGCRQQRVTWAETANQRPSRRAHTSV
jgi:hypothetical protein